MSEITIVCNMGVFTTDQREQHIENTRLLFNAVNNVLEVDNGFSFIWHNETETLHAMGEFIANERLCCPFLNFHLEVAGDNGPIILTLRGPIGTQEFLREEFQEAFS